MDEVSSLSGLKAFEDVMNHLGERSVPFLFVIDYEMTAPAVIPLDELGRYDIDVSIEGTCSSSSAPGVVADVEGAGETVVRPVQPDRSNAPARDGSVLPPIHFDLDPRPPSYERYLEAFQTVHRRFVSGETYLANLTFATPLGGDYALRDIYDCSRARYQLRFEDKFVVFSPESFVKIEDNRIASFPMKGTIDADIPNADAVILADEKETAEHVTIVDLIRNDIGMIAELVRVHRFRYIDRIETSGKTLLQVSSEITGFLTEDWPVQVGTIITRMLPAGSICGAPKRRTVEIIREAEPEPRGYYTGIFGVFDGEKLDSGVMIRFIERTDQGRLRYRSGGGLTIYSDPQKEYEELIDKIYVPVTRDDTIRKRPVSSSGAARSPDEAFEIGAVRNR